MDGGCVPSQGKKDTHVKKIFFFKLKNNNFIVLKNSKPLEPQAHNENVPTAYNTEIMNNAKTSDVIRGPTFY